VKKTEIPVEGCIGLSRSIRFRPEDLLFLDVIVDADAVLDVDDGGEVAVVLVLRVDVLLSIL